MRQQQQQEQQIPQLKRIEDMLAALLKSRKHLEWIGAYAHGRTSDGDPFIILYPANEKLREKHCRVYDRAFKLLPSFVSTEIPAKIQSSKATPSRPDAIRAGNYHECPLFQVVTHDGSENNGMIERRFYSVVKITNFQPAQPAQQPAQPAQQPAQPAQPIKPAKPVQNGRIGAGYVAHAKESATPSPDKWAASLDEPATATQAAAKIGTTTPPLMLACLHANNPADFDLAMSKWVSYYRNDEDVAQARLFTFGAFVPSRVSEYEHVLRAYSLRVSSNGGDKREALAHARKSWREACRAE